MKQILLNGGYNKKMRNPTPTHKKNTQQPTYWKVHTVRSKGPVQESAYYSDKIDTKNV